MPYSIGAINFLTQFVHWQEYKFVRRILHFPISALMLTVNIAQPHCVVEPFRQRLSMMNCSLLFWLWSRVFQWCFRYSETMSDRATISTQFKVTAFKRSNPSIFGSQRRLLKQRHDCSSRLFMTLREKVEYHAVLVWRGCNVWMRGNLFGCLISARLTHFPYIPWSVTFVLCVEPCFPALRSWSER